MKITIDCTILKNELQKLKELVSTRTSMPMLANVRISTDDTASDDTLIIRATDLEVSISTSCPCKIIEPGAIALPALTLLSIVSKVDEETITIETEDNFWAALTIQDSKCRITGTSASDYPKIPDDDDISYFPIDAHSFTKLIQKTSFSISSDDARPILTGAFLQYQIDNGLPCLTMVTTDGHRLSKMHMPATEMQEAGAPDPLVTGVIIPGKGINQLGRQIDHKAHPLEIGFDPRNVFLKHGPMTIVIRLIEGQYPDYRAIVPKFTGEALHVQREKLSTALQFIRIFSSSNNNRVRFTLDTDKLTLYAHSPEIGEGSRDIEAQYNGSKLEIGFNIKYLRDIISVLEGDEVALCIADTLSPSIIKDTSQDNLLYVVMPMRLS